MKIFSVSYNIPGCLPESDPEQFDTIEEAVTHVERAWDDAADALEDDTLTRGEDAVRIFMGATDPTPGSLYAWHIEEVDFVADPECEHCDGRGTEEKMGAGGYFAGFCTYCGEV